LKQPVQILRTRLSDEYAGQQECMESVHPSGWSTLNPHTKWAQQGRFTSGENAGIFYFLQIFFFANSEFIFAIIDLKLVWRGLEYTPDMAQNRGLFLLLPRKTKN